MRGAIRGLIWFGAYVAVVCLPLVLAAIGVAEEDRGFWRDFAVALGFVGLSMLGLQFVLVAGLRRSPASASTSGPPEAAAVVVGGAGVISSELTSMSLLRCPGGKVVAVVLPPPPSRKGGGRSSGPGRGHLVTLT